MRKTLQRILSVLCVLTLVLGGVSLAAFAEEDLAVHLIKVEWDDTDNYDAIRPASVEAKIGDQSIALSDANNWTGSLTAPADASWTLPDVDGYVRSAGGSGMTVVTYRHRVATSPLTAKVTWLDDNDANGIRPESVQLRLLANGKPYSVPLTANAKNDWTVTWEDLPKTTKGSKEAIAYSIEQVNTPSGYYTVISGTSVSDLLIRGNLVIYADVTGAPEGTDLSSLSLTVSGPDASMPRTVTLGEFKGGTYDFGHVIPGLYLVEENNADSLAGEGYVMDPSKSRAADATYVAADAGASLSFRYAYMEAPEEEPNLEPLPETSDLKIEILGPDPRMPMTITYSQFTNGTYELDDLVPGSYAVIERNAETLIRAYTLKSDSVTGMAIQVAPGGGAIASLYNHYAPYNTPAPEAELIDIPVTKTWNDNDNEDGNRPESITVHLYADGTIVDTYVMTAADGWAHTFTEKPRTKEDGTVINYTVNEDEVAWYKTTVNGYNIVNDYQPETVSLTVSKIWNDQDNAANARPTTLAVTLLPVGKIFILSADNGWTATASGLPTKINGGEVTYSWSEQESIGYVREELTTDGVTTVFTNRFVRLPEPPSGEKQPKKPGNTWDDLPEYDTALGLEVIINHVGDCFD